MSATELPAGLKFTKTHEWVSLNRDICTVGITKFAADQLTDITYIELPDVGDHVFIDREFGEIETVKAVSPLYSPVEGEVVETNAGLEEKPDPVKDDPWGAGWLIKVRVEKPQAALNHLLSPEDYTKQMAH